MNNRMAALVRMLGSTNDGEVANAARMLGAALKAHGLSYNDLGDYVARWSGVAAPEPARPVTPSTRTQANSPPGWQRRNAEPAVDRELVREQVDDLVNNYLSRLRRKDANFIESLAESLDIYGERTTITPAQASWVAGLYTMYAENKGRRR